MRRHSAIRRRAVHGSAGRAACLGLGHPLLTGSLPGLDERFGEPILVDQGAFETVPGAEEARLQLQGALHLADRLRVAARPVIHPADVGARAQGKRVQALGGLDLRQGLVEAPLGDEQPGVIVVDGRRAGIEREGAAEFGFGARAVAMKAKEDGAQGRARVGEIRLQLQGLARRRLGARIGLARRQSSKEGEEMDGIRETRLRPRRPRIESHRLLEGRHALAQVVRRAAPQEPEAFEIRIAGGLIGGGQIGRGARSLSVCARRLDTRRTVASDPNPRRKAAASRRRGISFGRAGAGSAGTSDTAAAPFPFITSL